MVRSYKAGSRDEQCKNLTSNRVIIDLILPPLLWNNSQPSNWPMIANYWQFTTQITVTKEMMAMAFVQSKWALVSRGADVAKFTKVYHSLSSYTMTDLAAEDITTTVTLYCSAIIQETITMMNRYFQKNWIILSIAARFKSIGKCDCNWSN